MITRKSVFTGLTIFALLLLVVFVVGISRNRRLMKMHMFGARFWFISTAAERYMRDKGVTQAAYADIVGTDRNAYYYPMSLVDGEDYSQIVITKTTTQISVSCTGFGIVTYNL